MNQMVANTLSASVAAPEFLTGMRRVAASVSIVAAREGEVYSGLTVTSVTSISADPPVLLVCVNRTARACAVIARTGAFSVNVLTDSQCDLAQVFATAPPETRFSHGPWELRRGVPVLARSAAGFLCDVVDAKIVGTHMMFFGGVVNVTAGNGGVLLYRDGAYGAFNGLPAHA
jgi:flavin reductase